MGGSESPSDCSHFFAGDALRCVAPNRREVNELALKSKLRSARRLISLASALLLAALVAIPSSGIALAQAPPDELTPRQRRPGFRRAQEKGRVRRPAPLRPRDRGPLLRRPGRRHRRLDKRHVPGEGRREEEGRRLGVLLGVPRPRRTHRARPRPGLPAGDAGRCRGRAEGRLLRRRPHLPAGPHLGQDSGRPQPGALGEGLRRLDDRGSPADERHPHRHPSRPHLRQRPGAPGVDGRLGHHLRRPRRDPGLDGAELHHGRAPGDPSGGMAGDGPPPGARPGGRRIVPCGGAPWSWTLPTPCQDS